ncbi:MAG: hypothetical protein ACTSRI_06405 [Promethearchaeota archaeon]
MTNNLKKIKNIITLEEYINNKEKYIHLFEVQLPPDDLKLFKPRLNFEMGNPLIGDLRLDLEKENMLEIHPFPEWVVQLKSPENVKCKPYLIVPNFSLSVVKSLARKSFEKKLKIIEQEVKKLTIDDLIAFKYEIGINILVRGFTPHFFISSKINKDIGEAPPYLQVFEPNMDKITRILKIKTTYFFKLPFSVMI